MSHVACRLPSATAPSLLLLLTYHAPSLDNFAAVRAATLQSSLAFPCTLLAPFARARRTKQNLNLTLLCSTSATDPDPTFVSYVPGRLSLEWATPDACPRSGGIIGGGGGGGGGFGFFGFIKFLFWMGLVGLVLYFAIGECGFAGHLCELGVLHEGGVESCVGLLEHFGRIQSAAQVRRDRSDRPKDRCSDMAVWAIGVTMPMPHHSG